MPGELLNEWRTRRLIVKLIVSNEWWVLPWLGHRSPLLSARLEDAVPSGADCQVVSGGMNGVDAVSFFRKAALPSPLVAAIFTDFGLALTEEDLATHNVLALTDPAEHEAHTRALGRWQSWLMGDERQN